MPRRVFNKDIPAFKPIECKICGKILSRKATLSEHIQDLHTNNKKITCTVENCNYKTNRIGNYNLHLQKVHKIDLPVTSCYTLGCGKKSRCEHSLIRHMRKCKGKPEFLSKKCPINGCREEFLTTRGMRSHLKIKHGSFTEEEEEEEDEEKKHIKIFHREIEELLIM